MKEKMLYLAFVMRNFGRSLLDASKSLYEESRLLKRLKIAKLKSATTLTTFTTLLIERELNKKYNVVFAFKKTTQNYKGEVEVS